MEGLLGSLEGIQCKILDGGLDFLDAALAWRFPYGTLPKQTSKKFASDLRSPSRSGLRFAIWASNSEMKSSYRYRLEGIVSIFFGPPPPVHMIFLEKFKGRKKTIN